MKVLVAEELPAKNKGETAILMGLLESLRPINPTEVTLLTGRRDIDEPQYSKYLRLVSRLHSSTGKDPGKPYLIKSLISYVLLSVFGKGALFLTDRRERDWWNCLLETDIVIIGHDNSMANGLRVDSYGLVFLAKLRRKMLVYYAGSFGPFRSKAKARSARIALNLGDLITLRESISYKYLKEIGVTNRNMEVTADLAFLMPAASRTEVASVLAQEGIEIDGPWLGINASPVMSKLAFPSSGSRNSQDAEFCGLFAALVDNVVEKLNARVLLVPHVFGAAAENDDRITLQRIYQMVRNKNKVVALKDEYPPQVLKGIIGELDFFVGCRTHSVIAATSMGIPSIALSSKGPEFMKTNGIVGEMMQLGDMILFAEDLDLTTFFQRLEGAWLDRTRISARLRELAIIVGRKAEQNGILLREACLRRSRKKR